MIRWIALFALGVLLLLPIGVGPYPIRVATVIFMWAALAGSWNLLAGYAGAVDLGPVVYHGIGAFVTAALMLKLGLPFLVSAGLAGVVAIAIAYAVGTPTLRLRGAYFAIGTLALAESTKQLALAWDRLTRIPLTGGSAGVSLPLSAGYVPFTSTRPTSSALRSRSRWSSWRSSAASVRPLARSSERPSSRWSRSSWARASSITT